MRTRDAWKVLRGAEARRAQIDAEGGPIKRHRASYLAACGVLDNSRRHLRAGLGILPLLPLLGWAAAALVGTATVAGGVAIATSTSAIASTGQAMLKALTIVGALAGAVWVAAKIAPTAARGYRQTTRELAA